MEEKRTIKQINKAIKKLSDAKKSIHKNYYGIAIGNDLKDSILEIKKAINIGEEEFKLTK